MYEKNLKNYVYVCPYCFNKINECQCEIYPEKLVQIDRRMWPIVKTLNEKGYFTKSCCEGHINKSNLIYIIFKKNYKFSIAPPKKLYC